jgi:hypothetical protein
MVKLFVSEKKVLYDRLQMSIVDNTKNVLIAKNDFYVNLTILFKDIKNLFYVTSVLV